MTPELVPFSPNFCTTPEGGRLAPYVRLSVQQVHIHGGSSVEKCFEPGTLQLRDLTTRPPRPHPENYCD
ncbi:hypothetical protein AVEN_198013-1, partial [Araneus ventricosus]